MAITVPAKIVLKSSTKMSLHDRFSNIVPLIQNIRAHMVAEQKISSANRRLAQQLANRSGLQASATNMYQQNPRIDGRQGNIDRQGNMHSVTKKKSLQERLGPPNVNFRLSDPNIKFIRGRGNRSRRPGRGQLMSTDGYTSQWMAGRGRGGYVPRGPRTRGGKGASRGRGRGTYYRSFGGFYVDDYQPQRRRRRWDYEGDRFPGQNNSFSYRRGSRGNSQNTRQGGRSFGRSWSGPRRRSRPNVTVEQLDNQLDAYMSKTKSHLDSELDAYMAEVTE